AADKAVKRRTRHRRVAGLPRRARPARSEWGMRMPCAGAVVRREDGRMLVIRRGRGPSLGLWSIPGGRAEPGEELRETAAREVLEETGLTVQVGARLGRVLLPAGDDEYD